MTCKEFINSEFEKISALESGADLYRIFFRLVQLFSALGLIFALVVSLPLLAQMSGYAGIDEFVNPLWILVPFLVPVIQLAAAEIAIRAVEHGKFRGVVIGLVLSALMIPSWLFLFGLFGLYCFLNKSFQQKHLDSAPLFYRKLLTAMNLNRLSEEASK